jgi:hypothetical protein
VGKGAGVLVVTVKRIIEQPVGLGPFVALVLVR